MPLINIFYNKHTNNTYRFFSYSKMKQGFSFVVVNRNVYYLNGITNQNIILRQFLNFFPNYFFNLKCFILLLWPYNNNNQIFVSLLPLHHKLSSINLQNTLCHFINKHQQFLYRIFYCSNVCLYQPLKKSHNIQSFKVIR